MRKGPVICWLAPAVVSLAAVLATGSLMRETDQASLVEGAWRIRQGTGISETGFYNYDKQYLSYILPAFFLHDFEGPLDETGIDCLVARLNQVAAGIFLTGLWVFVAGAAMGKRKAPPDGTFLIAFLTTPAVLLSVPVSSPAIMSAGFLLVLASLMKRSPGTGNFAACAAFTFLAVGTRADAVLCLPFFCWAEARPGSWKGLVKSSRGWWMAAGAVLALAVGRLLAGETATTFYHAALDPRVAGAYLAFGLGGLILTGFGFATLLGVNLRKRPGFRWAGLLFLAMPLLFYGPQLFSPRHLITTAIVILVAVTGFRGRALLRLGRRCFPRRVRVWKAAVVVVSLVPLLVGIRLPVPQRPGLTLRQPTLYPSTDGLWPMGGYAGYLVKMTRGKLDHNQQIWTSAKCDEMRWPEQSPLKILETPMRQYLLLAARLRGLTAEQVSIGEAADDPVLADERSLRVARPGHVTPSGIGAYETWLRQFRQRKMVWLSGAGTTGGVVLLNRVGPEKVEEHSGEDQMAREISILLGGVDVLEIDALTCSGKYTIAADTGGRSMAFSSRSGFTLQGRSAEKISSDHGEYFAATMGGAATAGLKSVDLDAGGEVRIWSSVLPEFMSRNRYRERLNTLAGR